MDEEKNSKEQTSEDSSNEGTGKGDESAADEKVKQLNADTERINKAIAENENAKARQKLGGVTEAGQVQEKPKEETPKEYRTRVEKEMAQGKTEFGN